METDKEEGRDLAHHKRGPLASSSYAPWYDVPRKSIVSIEHPFIIQNVDKGVASLGGAHHLVEVHVLID